MRFEVPIKDKYNLVFLIFPCQKLTSADSVYQGIHRERLNFAEVSIKFDKVSMSECHLFIEAHTRAVHELRNANRGGRGLALELRPDKKCN